MWSRTVLPTASSGITKSGATNEAGIWGTSLRMSPLSRPMLCRMTHAVIILHALSGLARRPVWSALNLFFRTPNVCSIVTLKTERQKKENKVWCVVFGRLSEVMGVRTCLVLQWAELNLWDGAVSVEIYGVIKYGFKPYPESPKRVPWIWPKIIYTII